MLAGGTQAVVACCLCGTSTTTPPFCGDCLKAQADLSAELKPSGTLTMCKRCGRFLTKSKHWVTAELESQELLSLTLKYVQGLSKLKLQDASFIWTEPHSRRIKVRLNVKKEVMHGVDVSQKVELEFVVKTFQCDDCNRSFTEQTWKALVQIRQRVEHKKTFYFLEQLLLAKRMQDQVLDIDIQRDGMDLYFGDKNVAQQFVAFLSSIVPQRSKASRKVVSEDRQNNSHNNQHTFAVEIVPLCKDDLVLVPPKSVGGISGLCLVSRVTSVVHLVDPTTMQHAELPAAKFFRAPFSALFTSKELIEFEVLDVELMGPPTGGSTEQRGQLAEVEVVKSSDYGASYRLVTHLGHLLSVGDTVMGYDVRNSVLAEEALEGLKYDPPDIVLVKKVEPNKKERRRLKRLLARKAQRAAKAKASASAATSVVGDDEEDFVQFARELEEDEEMRRILEEHEAQGDGREDMQAVVFYEEDEEGEGVDAAVGGGSAGSARK